MFTTALAASAALTLNLAAAPNMEADGPERPATQVSVAAATGPVIPIPVFKLINHEEDWRGFRDPASGSSLWADLKAIPVGPGAGWLSIGGEARWRVEYRGHERFGRGAQDDDGDFQQRLRLWADYRPTESGRLFIDLQDARTSGLDSGEPVIDESRLDVHQGFLEYQVPVGGGALRVRAGRQEFGLGMFRIFDTREGPNARGAYDMVRVFYDRPKGWSAGVFGGYAIREGKATFDDATNFDSRIFGATTSRRFGTGESNSRLEILYANTDRLGVMFDTGIAGRDQRDTVSVRFDGRRERYDFDLEAVGQGGDYRGLSVRSWYVSGIVGRTFDHRWAPRVAVRLDAASGDRNRNDGVQNTYNQLNVPPISMRTDFGVANLVSIQPQITFRPVSSTMLGLSTAGLWRQSDQDGVYLLSGLPLRGGLEGRSRHVGWRYAGWAIA